MRLTISNCVFFGLCCCLFTIQTTYANPTPSCLPGWKLPHNPQEDGPPRLSLPAAPDLKSLRADLANKTIVFIGDSLLRYQYLSFVYFLKFARFPETGVLNKTALPKYSISYAHSRGWPNWQVFYEGATTILGSQECCECDKERGIENRFFRDPVNNVNVSFYSFRDGARGSSQSLLGWTPTCRQPVVESPQHFTTTQSLPALKPLWPPSPDGPSLPSVADSIETVFGKQSVDVLVANSALWTGAQVEFKAAATASGKGNATVGLGKDGETALLRLESVMKPGRVPIWMTVAGKSYLKHPSSKEAPLLRFVSHRQWDLLPRRRLLSQLHFMLAAKPELSTIHPFLDNVHLTPFMNAELNRLVLHRALDLDLCGRRHLPNNNTHAAAP